MVKESTLCVSLQKFCNYAGVTYKSTHTCRRSYVTTCLDNDMKLAQVSANVGHKNKSTTLNTYYKCKNNYEDNMEIQNKIFILFIYILHIMTIEKIFKIAFR
ncbi:phage integrase family protein [Lachnotalea glycerini]|uniref:Phage integrase family protein n=1 Tax=Lachnotalea glycerini TaxID=1763509 RepID=A0A318ES87_9FIRM|nr:phage integrase family protein [Lachnotalea glycerini]